ATSLSDASSSATFATNRVGDKYMRMSTKAGITAAISAAFVFSGPSAWATSDSKHADPCPEGTERYWVYKVTGGTDHKDDERYICIKTARDGKDGKDGKD